MPTYNRAFCIRDAIDSVLSQTCGDWELIIADDGSTDDTAAVVASYADPRISFLPCEKNGGPAAARNRDMIIFLPYTTTNSHHYNCDITLWTTW